LAWMRRVKSQTGWHAAGAADQERA
jgi:hypothetical protein